MKRQKGNSLGSITCSELAKQNPQSKKVYCSFVYRIRLPEDRDPRQGQSPLFGVHVAPEGDHVGVVKLGDSVTVMA